MPQEPRFKLPDGTPRSSKTPLVISGLQVYIYGLENLSNPSPGVDIAVLYLAHNRTRTYLVTEGIAHEVLNGYRIDGRPKTMDLIAVTFNMRNHGDREISPAANRTWKDGNETHGIDLMSMIDGSALDFKLVMSYLPAYLPQFSKFHNIMAGVSLGGHTAWRMPAVVPGQIEAMCMVVGCPSLTALLLSRLRFDPALLSTTATELYKVPYDDLVKVLNEKQKGRWPRALHELISAQDQKIEEEFPDVPLLLMGGKEDPLVPIRHTQPWVEQRKESKKIEFFVQENTGHSCTLEMVGKLHGWLADMFAAK